MATMKFEDMTVLAKMCIAQLRADLSPGKHIKERAHFSPEEDVRERMRRERKTACSSFYGYLTETEVCDLICNSLLWDCECAEREALGVNKSTGMTKCTGHIVMEPLEEETEEPIQTGFAIYFDEYTKKQSAPKACRKIKICLSWEEYEDGTICAPLFSIESIFPIRN